MQEERALIADTLFWLPLTGVRVLRLDHHPSGRRRDHLPDPIVAGDAIRRGFVRRGTPFVRRWPVWQRAGLSAPPAMG